MPKYQMLMAVDGLFSVDVEADDLAEATALANRAFDDADLGCLKDASGELVWYSEDGDPHDSV